MSGLNLLNSRLRGKPPFAQPVIDLIEYDRHDNNGANNDIAVILIDAEDHDAARDYLNDESAEARTEGSASSPGETGAAHDRRRDYI